MSILLIGLVIPAVACAAKPQTITKNIQGSFQGAFTVTPFEELDGDGNWGMITAEGKGNFMHLGLSNLAFDMKAKSAEDYSYDTLIGTITITAANGDKIMADFSGIITYINVDADLTLGNFDGTYTISGGNGRFNGASSGPNNINFVARIGPDHLSGSFGGNLGGNIILPK